MLEVQRCTGLVFGTYKELPTLFAEYAQASSIDGMPRPKPNEDLYLRLERAGISHLAVALYDGALIGFLLLIVNDNPHYSTKIGVAESFFVAQAHRHTGAGLKLMKWAETTAKAQGAAGLFISAPVASDLAKVMERKAERKQYVETNRVFFRSFANE